MDTDGSIAVTTSAPSHPLSHVTKRKIFYDLEVGVPRHPAASCDKVEINLKCVAFAPRLCIDKQLHRDALL